MSQKVFSLAKQVKKLVYQLEESTAFISFPAHKLHTLHGRTNVDFKTAFRCCFHFPIARPHSAMCRISYPRPLTFGPLFFCTQPPKQPVHPVSVGAIVGIVLAGLLLVGLIILWVYLYKTGRLKGNKCCGPRDPAAGAPAAGTRDFSQPAPAAYPFPAHSAPPATTMGGEMGSVPARPQNHPVMVASAPAPAAAAFPASASAPESEHPPSPPPAYKTPAKHRARSGAPVDESSPASGSAPPPDYKTPAKSRAQNNGTGTPEGESPASDGGGAPPPAYKTPAKGWA